MVNLINGEIVDVVDKDGKSAIVIEKNGHRFILNTEVPPSELVVELGDYNDYLRFMAGAMVGHIHSLKKQVYTEEELKEISGNDEMWMKGYKLAKEIGIDATITIANKSFEKVREKLVKDIQEDEMEME